MMSEERMKEDEIKDPVSQGQQLLGQKPQMHFRVDEHKAEVSQENSLDNDQSLEEFNQLARPSRKPFLPEQFEIVRELGKGGMSVVYHVIDHKMPEPFNEKALKLLHESLAADPTVAKRFAREAELVRRLDHPRIVKIEGVGTTDSGLPYLELELVEGISLSELLAQQQHLSPYHACQIAYQISDALDHALKQGVIHRDLKPSNILVSKIGDEYEVKVLDFGIAKTLERDIGTTSGLTRTGDVFGSPAYMSPEQCTGGALDSRSDIYSLGCVMYEMLTGVNPFAADNPIKSILRHVEEKAEPFEIEFAKLRIPKELEKIVLKCLEKSQNKRYRDPAQLKKQLANVLGLNPLPWWELQLRKLHSNFTDLIILTVACLFASAGPESVRYWLVGVGMILYYALSEHSIFLRGTPGKVISRLQIGTAEGKSMSIAQSFFRALCLTPVVMLICVAYSYIQNLETLDLTKGFEPLLLLVFFLCSLTLFDKLCGRRITRRATVLSPMKVSRLLEFHFDRNKRIAALIAVCSIPAIVAVSNLNRDLQTRIDTDPNIVWNEVLYATKDIPEGTEIPADAVELKKVLERKTPMDAVEDEDTAVGKISKYGISGGQIITTHDIASN